jgi:(p)ppGpp synthase/HD superfamily hydrolase
MPLSWSQDTYIGAFRHAAQAYKGQLIPKTDLSYRMHLGLVCMEIIAALAAKPVANPKRAISWALLHDTIEDKAISRIAGLQNEDAPACCLGQGMTKIGLSAGIQLEFKGYRMGVFFV